MVYQAGTYVQGNLFRGNYKAPYNLPHTPRTGHAKANNIGYDLGYYGMLGYGLYQERAALGSVASTIGRGLASVRLEFLIELLLRVVGRMGIVGWVRIERLLGRLDRVLVERAAAVELRTKAPLHLTRRRQRVRWRIHLRDGCGWRERPAVD